MNNNTLIMCNRRTISETITGPATDALERSLKRPRTEKSNKVHIKENNHTTFYFPELYRNLVATNDGGDEDFPSISWNFDNESDNDDNSYTVHDYVHPNTLSFMKCTKDVSNSMQRSKSFRTNLADMSESPAVFSQLLMFESNLEPIRMVDEVGTTRIFPMITKACSDSIGFEAELHARTFSSKIPRQDHVGDQCQNSLGLDAL